MERESSDVVDQHVSFGDLDALIAALVSAAQEEIDKFKVLHNVLCVVCPFDSEVL